MLARIQRVAGEVAQLGPGIAGPLPGLQPAGRGSGRDGPRAGQCQQADQALQQAPWGAGSTGMGGLVAGHNRFYFIRLQDLY